VTEIYDLRSTIYERLKVGVKRLGIEKSASGAFTRTELLVIIVIVLMVVALLVPAMQRTKERGQRITCTSNLKIIGEAFATWALDHTNQFATRVSTAFGGSQEHAGKAFRHFQVLSKELGSPAAVLCPADARRPANDFGPNFSNSNVSYFVGLDATDAQPMMLVAGDRNLTNGTPPLNGILMLTTNSIAGWTHELHKMTGQVLIADGSVQQMASFHPWQFLIDSDGTNRLAMP
jgi:competence protein ComGC